MIAMPHTHRLSIGHIDVWLADATTSARSDSHISLLDDDERMRHDRFRTQASRTQYVIGHALLRTTLTRYTGVPERDWHFEIGAFGRPSIRAPHYWRHLQFNLSHTDGLAACAIGIGCRIGIDIENISRRIDLDGLPSHALAAPEVASLDGVADDVRRLLFFRYWTLKEAYLKANGRGLSIPLDAFWFDLNGNSPGVHFSERCPDTGWGWQFRDHAAGNAHRLAVTVSTDPAAPKPMAVRGIELRWALALSHLRRLPHPSPHCPFLPS